MTAQNDMIKLYSGKILALAADIPRLGRLDKPSATAKTRSPLCGSTVTVDIIVTDGQITDFAHDVKACALGQAAASIVAAHIIGCNRETVKLGRDHLFDMLTQGGMPPEPPFSDMQVLQPAAEFRNRHASILLTFDAILKAFDSLEDAA